MLDLDHRQKNYVIPLKIMKINRAHTRPPGKVTKLVLKGANEMICCHTRSARPTVIVGCYQHHRRFNLQSARMETNRTHFLDFPLVCWFWRSNRFSWFPFVRFIFFFLSWAHMGPEGTWPKETNLTIGRVGSCTCQFYWQQSRNSYIWWPTWPLVAATHKVGSVALIYSGPLDVRTLL